MKLKKAQCRTCGADIVWAIDGNGTRVPLNWTRVRAYTPDSRFVEGAFCVERSVDPVWISHFLTCPKPPRKDPRAGRED